MEGRGGGKQESSDTELQNIMLSSVRDIAELLRSVTQCESHDQEAFQRRISILLHVEIRSKHTPTYFILFSDNFIKLFVQYPKPVKLCKLLVWQCVLCNKAAL